MASYEYRIQMSETVSGKVEWWEVAHCPIGGWTHASATAWCHTGAPRVSTHAQQGVRIERRRGGTGAWVVHRTYTVGADGIVRRTDRTSQKA